MPDEKNGLNDEGSVQFMESIKQGVIQFRQRLVTNRQYVNDPQCNKVVKQIDQYGDKLFADPIVLDRPSGTVIIYPQRTNNILEQFFRRLRRDYRRRTGNNSMRKALQAMLADTPLIKNLSNPAYLKILLGGKQSLEELFAEIEIKGGAAENEGSAGPDSVLRNFRSLIKIPDLPARISSMVTTRQMSFCQSN
jgi:hypothetical protein